MAESSSRCGTLLELSYPELLQRLKDEHHTGTLTLRRHGLEKTAYLQGGRVVFARSTNPDDRLGEFLVGKGAIGIRHYLSSVEQVHKGKRQGTALVEMGAITPEELVQYVKEQILEILYSPFLWIRGDYEIRSEELPVEVMIILNITIEEVLLNGIRRMKTFLPIWRGLGADLGAVLAPTPNAEVALYRVSLTADESAVFSLVNGKSDIQKILAMSYSAEFVTLRSLFAFLLIGVIEPRATAGPAEEAPHDDYELEELIESYNRVLVVIYDFVAERLEDLVNHLTDRAVAELGEASRVVLKEVRLHNRGRVEYEQIYANVGSLPTPERHQSVALALNELLASLLRLTLRELGRDEAAALASVLDGLVGELPDVPLPELIAHLE